jgi:hypothetical protein
MEPNENHINNDETSELNQSNVSETDNQAIVKNSRKKIIIISAIAFLIIAGLASAYYLKLRPLLPSPSPKVEELAGWKIYKSDKLGFSFKYPADIDNLKDSGTSISLSKKGIQEATDDQEFSYPAIDVGIADRRNDESMEEAVEASVPMLLYFTDAPLEKNSQKESASGNQKVLVFSIFDGGEGDAKKEILRIYAFEKLGRVYTVTSSVEKSAVVEKMTKSFEFIEPAASTSLIELLWEKYRYESYGFEFKLPEGWQQIESKTPDNALQKLLTFTPKSVEYEATPENQQLEIIIRENPDQLSYEKLFENKEYPNSANIKYEGDDILVGGKSAKLDYAYPEMKLDPMAIVPLEKRYLHIHSPRENLDFIRPRAFKDFLSTFNFFEPIPGASNTSKPAQRQENDNLFDWCAKAPNPGHCYADIAKKEKNPDPSWCTAITPQNSEELYYVFKNECYKYVASKLKDISLCDKMVGDPIQTEIYNAKAIRDCKDWVNYELALQNNDINYCNKIDIDTYFDDGYGMDTVSYSNCYVAIAVKMNDQHICDKIIPLTSSNGRSASKEWCYYNFAVAKKDCSLVPQNSPAPKSQCESEVKDGI